METSGLESFSLSIGSAVGGGPGVVPGLMRGLRCGKLAKSMFLDSVFLGDPLCLSETFSVTGDSFPLSEEFAVFTS